MKKIIDELDNGVIIITPNNTKKEILKYLTDNKLLYNIKFYTLEEFKKNYLYEYSDLTLYYISEKYNLEPSISKVILDNLYYITNANYDNEKLNFLLQIKNDLEANNYLKYNSLFKKSLINKKIIIYNYYEIDNFYLTIFNKLKENNTVLFINEEYKHKENLDIYEFKTIEDEVVFLADNIIKLINKGININNIKINKLSSEYHGILNRIFSYFKIPYNLETNNKIIGFDITKYFLELLDTSDDLTSIMDIIKESYDLDNKINYDIYNKLLDIVSIYIDIPINKAIKYIKYHIEKASIKSLEYIDSINEIDIKNYIPNNDDYIFILGLNQDVLPINFKDDDYLSDELKSILKIDTSLIKNNKENKNLIFYLDKIDNLYISYKLNTPFKEYIKSSFLSNYNLNYLTYSYDYSNISYNNYLLSLKIDNLIKYNEKDENLSLLYNNAHSNYMTYDNSYHNISNNKLYEYLDNKLVLSYSSMETFFKCKFRFYLNNILKLDQNFKETVSITVGKLVHQILCRVLKENENNYETIINEEISTYFKNKELTIKDEFYIEKYKKEILKLIEIIMEQNSRTNFENTYFEEKFEIDKSNTIEIKILGFIDKVLTFKDNDNTYVIVVDYKTGTIHSNFNNVIYGLNMQLLVYLYLLKNTNKLKNVKFAGVYFQNIMKDILTSEKDKTYDNLLFDSYKLDGYTTTNVGIVKNIDTNLDKSYLKSIKLKKDETFYGYSKVLTDSDIEKLLDIVSDNIDICIKDDLNSDFKINPKRIGTEKLDEITGCSFCSFFDICYKKNDDIVNLKEYKKMEFLGGEDNDTN